MRNKITSAAEAVAIVQSGDAICTSGFVGIGVPDALLVALERRFLDTGEPRDLTLLFAAGQGDGKERGLNALGHEGLLRCAIGGHWGLIPKVGRLALEGHIEAYNLPQGVISHMYRDIAAGKPGTISRVGLGTFVDPRLEGGKINERTTEDIVRLIEIDGQEWLFYRGFPLQIAFLRGTTADPNGNVTAEREALDLDNLAMAMAVKNSGGVVIVQVERIARSGSLNPRQVLIPGVLVDCVVVAEPKHHWQTYATAYNPAYSAETSVPLDALSAVPLDAHWRRVHGPLALRVEAMRAYRQNHILARLPAREGDRLHRVDGISQLWFDNVESMRVAMESAEQRACIEDIREFLSDVTILIQQEGERRQHGDVDRLPVKFIYLLAGPEAAMKTMGIGSSRISPRVLPMPRFALTRSSIEASPWIRPFRPAAKSSMPFWNSGCRRGRMMRSRSAS